jgi:SAM-dependent methyltransferase
MNNLYQNYLDRSPSPFGERLVRKWHRQMANVAKRYSGIDWGTIKCLEIGPGHGYFADLVVSRGADYRFDDISGPVIEKMTAKGFQQVRHESDLFDVVWLSHVLEHSTDWVSARELLAKYSLLLKDGGKIIIIGPDYLSWGKRFFDVDATHGYPTTLRTVAQLLRDIGLDVGFAEYHRGGHLGFIARSIYAIVALLPISLGKLIFARRKLKSDDHSLYSWKAVLGWRQIFVVGSVGSN